MKTVKALIVDDERIACDLLRKMLAQYAQIEVIGTATSGREAVQTIRAFSPDLVFLDIQMPDRSGFDVLEVLGERDLPFIIFVTAHDEYALKAFEIHALDYLLKPFDEDRLRRCIQRALKQIEDQSREQFAQKVLSILTDARLFESGSRDFPRRLSIKTTSKIEFMEVDAIDWVEAADQYIKIYSGEKTHLLRMSMMDLEESLDPASFFRVHRSAIVNVRFVREVLIKGHGDCFAVLENGTKVRVSRFRKNQFLESLGNMSPPKEILGTRH